MAIFSKIFICIILFTAIFGTLALGSDIYHIPPHPISIGDALTFEATIPIDIEVVEALFFYRVHGQQSYREKQMEFLRSTWKVNIPKAPEGGGIEYFFLFELQDGSQMVLPEEDPNQNPFKLYVIPTPKSDKNDPTEISSSRKGTIFLF